MPLVGAVFLRAAIALANKVFKSESVVSEQVLTRSENKDIDDDSFNENPYAAPATIAKIEAKKAIAEPRFGRAYQIALVQILVTYFLNFVLQLLLSNAPVSPLLVRLISFLVGLVVATFLFSAMIPTTRGKALVVYLFQTLIVFALGVLIGVFVIGLSVL